MGADTTQSVCQKCHLPTLFNKKKNSALRYCSTRCRMEDISRLRTSVAKRAPEAEDVFGATVDKLCCTCKRRKSLHEFHKTATAKDGHAPRCKPCKKKQAAEYQSRNRELIRRRKVEWTLKNKDKVKAGDAAQYAKNRDVFLHRRWAATIKRLYGITYEEYEAMAAAQEYRCAVCNQDPKDRDPKRGRLVIDHDHSTGKVRSLLCACCNIGIGHFMDSAKVLRVAADYIEKWSDNHEKKGVHSGADN